MVYSSLPNKWININLGAGRHDSAFVLLSNPNSAFRIPHSHIMFSGFSKIIEERIRKAQKKGAFENLEGAGKPLDLKDDSHIAEDLRLAHKILKNADFLPPEIELKKEIQRTEDLLSGMKDTAQKHRTLNKLNYLIMKLNAARDTSIELEMPQQYSHKLVDRLEAREEKRLQKK